MLKREPEKEAEPGRGGESAGCPGTPPPAPSGGPRALWGGLAWGRRVVTRRAGGKGDPAPGFACSVTRPLRGPGPRLQRRASWHLPAHPASLGRERGGGALRLLRRGRRRQGVLENRAASPSPPLRPGPRERDRATPFSPPRCPPPHRFPIVLSPSLSRGRGEGVPRSGLKGPSPSPSCLLAGGEREWGGACPRAPAPLVPQPSSGAAARIGAGSNRRTPPPCVLRATGAFQDAVDLGGGVDNGDRDAPFSGSRRGAGGADLRQGQQPPWSQAQGLRAQRAGRALRRRQAGARPPPGVTGPAAASRNGGTSRKEPGPRVEAAASPPRLSLEGARD